MRRKPVVPRVAANRDVDAVIDYYLADGAVEAAWSFIAGIERTFDQIGRHPALGSPAYGQELRIPGLRCWPLRGFPFLVFYIERGAAVDVWRVLHGKRDIPAWLLIQS